MDQVLRPQRFSVNPNSPDAADAWNHWRCTFENYLEAMESPKLNKLKTLYNFISPEIYKIVSSHTDYDAAMSTLEDIYVEERNEVCARHLLATARQETNENFDQFLLRLRILAKDCNFKAVSAKQNSDDAIRDAFISGMLSTSTRQRLLEQSSLDLRAAFDQAKALETAEKRSKSFIHHSHTSCKITHTAENDESAPTCPPDNLNSTVSFNLCFFCGNSRHPRYKCPARDSTCKSCGKKGHFSKVCRSGVHTKHSASVSDSLLSSITTAAAPMSLTKAVTNVLINGTQLQALIDTGSSESYISDEIVRRYGWPIEQSRNQIILASTRMTSTTQGHCYVSLRHKDNFYDRVKLSILPFLCADVLLGHNFLELHKTVEIRFNGHHPSLSICGLTAARVNHPSLFAYLSTNCRPIATKSRRHTQEDELFIQSEVARMLKEGIIEPSKSPWRAQVLVTTNERQKKRMVIDYSQTINRYTHLDAYPLPRIDSMVENISRYKFFSALDLESAYHQFPIKNSDKPYTAFEACNNLYQFCRIPFGVTNGVACFQRAIDEIIRSENLQGTFAYVDNITICGKDLSDHHTNLRKFLDVASKYGLTLNDKKCKYTIETICLLGYEVSNGVVKPDPERFRPLMDLPLPRDLKAQQRIVGMFAYYSQWISHFSDKIHPLIHNRTFPLPASVVASYEHLKSELIQAAVVTIDKKVPLVVETDASDIAISATLNQNGRPVAFFSRTLTPSERHHSSVEKEACAIVEAIRKWRHYLLGSHFKLITDQRSVAFMYDSLERTKIKNDKIQRWRIELSSYSYDVVYRPGVENKAADTLSRAFCSSLCPTSDLKRLHDTLCHPGITRFYHFVRSKNLPFSLDDVKSVIQQCRICAELKPRFFKPSNSGLIKATQPFERISMDFKGPLPSTTRNKYILTVIDEYSRFPFAFACTDMTSSTIVSCLVELFSIFGLPSFVHSDRGSSFMSDELKQFLHNQGIATSRSTPYNPQSNGQVERLNATLWKSITLCLRSKNLELTQWELVLPEALHSIRSLLCTTTNATPHERMFSHNRRSSAGTSLPQWLLSSKSVLMRRHGRSSKYEPLVHEVELLDCNPEYAHVRFPNGSEETVSLRHLAPVEDRETQPSNSNDSEQQQPDVPTDSNISSEFVDPISPSCPESTHYENLISQQQRTRPYFLRNREA